MRVIRRLLLLIGDMLTPDSHFPGCLAGMGWRSQKMQMQINTVIFDGKINKS